MNQKRNMYYKINSSANILFHFEWDWGVFSRPVLYSILTHPKIVSQYGHVALLLLVKSPADFY